MQSAEKVISEASSQEMLDDCADSVIRALNRASGKPILSLQQCDIVRNAVASALRRNAEWFDGERAGAATVKDFLTVQARDRLEGLRQWADDNCPEGVAGAPDDVRWLLSYAEGVAAADLHQRLSDAVTLLYTHGVITEKMRAHARRNL